jgi:hypothetical protein
LSRTLVPLAIDAMGTKKLGPSLKEYWPQVRSQLDAGI